MFFNRRYTKMNRHLRYEISSNNIEINDISAKYYVPSIFLKEWTYRKRPMQYFSNPKDVSSSGAVLSRLILHYLASFSSLGILVILVGHNDSMKTNNYLNICENIAFIVQPNSNNCCYKKHIYEKVFFCATQYKTRPKNKAIVFRWVSQTKLEGVP